MWINSRRGAVALSALAFLAFSPLAAVPCRAQFSLGAAANYAVLEEPNNSSFKESSDSGVTGNVGIGSPLGSIDLAGGFITGNLDFSGAAPSNPAHPGGGSNYNGTTGPVTQNNANVTSALNTVNSLSTTLAPEVGTVLSTLSGGGQVIQASSGTLIGGNEVFSITLGNNKFNNLSNGTAGTGITINGTSSQFVVININYGTNNESTNGPVVLTGGITEDHVLFNFIGTGGEFSGGTANKAIAEGTYLLPNMKVNLNGATIDGHLFGGGTGNDFSIVSLGFVNGPTSVPEPSSAVIVGVVALLGLGWGGLRRVRHRSA